MTYNIHPIIVHFPIALLFIYSVIKILPLAKWWPNVSWKHIERVFLFLGVLGAIAALITGNIAKGLVRPEEDLVNAHSMFAFFTVFLYAVLLFGETVAIFKSKCIERAKSKRVEDALNSIENVLSSGVISKIIAFVALISITITGMLGGVMVYGLSADPFAGTVLKLLGIELQ